MERWAVELVLLLMYVLVRYYIVRFPGEGENDGGKKGLAFLMI